MEGKTKDPCHHVASSAMRRMCDEPRRGLQGRKLYIHPMAYCGTRALSAALESIGIEVEVLPPSDSRTLELGAKYTSGDECYPQKITLGDYLKVLERDDPRRVAFFMPTAEGPCRFGQYVPLLRKVLDDIGYREVPIISPSAGDGYDGIGEFAGELMRTGWRAVIASDILGKLLLKTRPYEAVKGATEEAFQASLDDVCGVLRISGLKPQEKLERLVASLIRCRERFRAVPANYKKDVLFIGVVGEIFCRLNTFSNEDVIRKIEEYGGEAWLSDVAEWIWYTNIEQRRLLRLTGKGLSLSMLQAKLKGWVQKADEHALYAPFEEDFHGYEEPGDIQEILDLCRPYLPQEGASGEMVLSAGKAVYLYQKGVDGIVDLSPFTCMNGITCEAIYPRLSRDHEGIPIKNFYFDGTQSNLDRDVGIFMEMARNYRRKKTRERLYPYYFKRPAL